MMASMIESEVATSHHTHENDHDLGHATVRAARVVREMKTPRARTDQTPRRASRVDAVVRAGTI